MLEINESSFEDSIRTGVSLVDFSASWCGPCRQLTPVLETLQNAHVFKIDIDANGDVATNYRISSIPCLVFFKDGVEQSRLVGVQSQRTLQKVIDDLNAAEVE